MKKIVPSKALKVEVLARKSDPPHKVKKRIMAKLGCGKTRAGEIYNEILEEENTAPANLPEPNEKSEWANSLTANNEKYYYNEQDDKYIVFLKSACQNVVIDGSMHRAMMKAYSNWDGNPKSINEVCRSFDMPRAWFIEYKTIMAWTHDREPVTNEELKDADPNVVVQDLLQQKRLAVYRKFNAESWKETQEQAEKWQQFKANKLDPFEQFITNWKPTKKTIAPAKKQKDSATYVIGAFDWHMGLLAEARYLYRSSKTWDMEACRKRIREYAQKIIVDATRKNYNFEKAIFLMGGDLYHSLTGKTEKGTQLITDKIRDTQLEAIADSLVEFINTLRNTFKQVDCHFIRGNHGGTTDFGLGLAMKYAFQSDPKVNFELYSQRTALIKHDTTLMLVDHGASDMFQSSVPKSGKARDSYIQSLLLAHPEKLLNVKQKLFIMGDKHHFVEEESNDFEYFMFGSLVGADQYSDNLNLNSRPRQNALILDSDGIRDVVHFFFESD